MAILKDEVTRGYCKVTTTNFVDRSVSAKSCDGGSDGFVHRALANGMYEHCDAWCLYDWESPDKISYHWNNHKKCFEYGSDCQGHKEQALVTSYKDVLCEAEKMCTPVAPKLSEAVIYRYCEKLSTNGEDRSPKAKGCHASYTPYVRRSLANKMFSHCGAWCLYDYDQPDTVAYHWNSETSCWQRGSGCIGHAEQKLSLERKATFCEADLCIPVQSLLSDTLMSSYCESTTVDHSPHAKTCDSAQSNEVHMALANKMFSSCSSTCLFSFDNPSQVAFTWNIAGMCWKKTDSCGTAAERAAAVTRKSKFCKV